MTLHIPTEVEQLARLVANKTGKTPEDIMGTSNNSRYQCLIKRRRVVTGPVPGPFRVLRGHAGASSLAMASGSTH